MRTCVGYFVCFILTSDSQSFCCFVCMSSNFRSHFESWFLQRGFECYKKKRRSSRRKPHSSANCVISIVFCNLRCNKDRTGNCFHFQCRLRSVCIYGETEPRSCPILIAQHFPAWGHKGGWGAVLLQTAIVYVYNPENPGCSMDIRVITYTGRPQSHVSQCVEDSLALKHCSN